MAEYRQCRQSFESFRNFKAVQLLTLFYDHGLDNFLTFLVWQTLSFMTNDLNLNCGYKALSLSQQFLWLNVTFDSDADKP